MLIYLDNNATTRPAPEVVAAMMPYLEGDYANPSSPYTFARRASLALDRAREEVAMLAGVEASDLIFTSGGTESNNTALRMVWSLPPERRSIAVTAVEHASVLAVAEALEAQGVRVTHIPVSTDGKLDDHTYDAILAERPGLVSIMAANNETGVLFPVAELARRAREHGALIHCDAVQLLGKCPLALSEMEIDFASFSAHKIHGPKGIGALYVRGGRLSAPYSLGGGQEQGRRAGTENVPGAVGFGVAAALAREMLANESAVRARRDRFERAMKERIENVHVVGERLDRLPNTSLCLFDGVETETLLALLDMEDICCSSGSACQAGAAESSHVLQAMGWPRKGVGAVRVSLSRYTDDVEIDRITECLAESVLRLRTVG